MAFSVIPLRGINGFLCHPVARDQWLSLSSRCAGSMAFSVIPLRGIDGRAIFPYPAKEKELRRVPSRNRATVALIQSGIAGLTIAR
jgi:hypothetical protein